MVFIKFEQKGLKAEVLQDDGRQHLKIRTTGPPVDGGCGRGGVVQGGESGEGRKVYSSIFCFYNKILGSGSLQRKEVYLAYSSGSRKSKIKQPHLLSFW